MIRRVILSASLLLVSALAQAEITGLFTFPGGSNGTVQYSDDGMFGGDSDFTFSTSTNRLSVSSASITYVEFSTAGAVSRICFADGTCQTTASLGDGTDDLGNHIATTTLNMSNFAITNVSTITVSSATVSILNPTTITGSITDLSTATHSGTHTFSTIAGTITDNSTTTHSGAHTFNKAMTIASSVTWTGALMQTDIPMNSTKLTGLAAGSSNGDSARFEQLKILQVQYGTIAVATNTTSSTYINSNLQRTITPLSASSTIYAYVAIPALTSTTGAQSASICGFRLVRDSTTLATWDRSSGYSAAANIQDSRFEQFSTWYPDQPGDTSSHTYRIHFSQQSGLASTCELSSNGTRAVMILVETQ